VFSSIFLFETTGCFRLGPLLWEVRLPRHEFLGRKRKNILQKQRSCRKHKVGLSRMLTFLTLRKWAC